MYIDVVPNRNSPPAILLRESVRCGSKVGKRTIANISHWRPERIEAVRRALKGEFDNPTNGKSVSGPVFGLLFALKSVAEQLGIAAALGRKRSGKLGLFLVLARVAHQGSRLSAVRWARNHAVAEVLGAQDFSEDDLYQTLEDLAKRQDQIELQLYRQRLQPTAMAPVLFLYDVTSSYLEGEKNELAEYGYNRDGKRGKKQIVIGLLADAEGEPLSVRVFAGNTSDPSTVPEQIETLKRKFQVKEVAFVGDRGMVKAKGKQALTEQGMRYITALTDPQIRGLLKRQVIQLGLFEEKVCEVEVRALRYVLRKNDDEERKIHHRLEDKLHKLEQKVQQRNEQVGRSLRCQPEAGLKELQPWCRKHCLSGFVSLELAGREIQIRIDEAARQQSLQLAGCYVIETNVPQPLLDSQAVHDRYKDLSRVERDFRSIKTGFLEVRPIYLRKGKRTRGHVLVCLLALKLKRELERRIAAAFGNTDDDRYALTLPDALSALSRLCLQTCQIDENHQLTRLPLPDATQQRILQTLKVRLPKY